MSEVDCFNGCGGTSGTRYAAALLRPLLPLLITEAGLGADPAVIEGTNDADGAAGVDIGIVIAPAIAEPVGG